jgi:hypothetical protein
MPTAVQTDTTSTRRSALGFSAAALVAGFTVPAIAGTLRRPDPDAELITLCAEAVRCEDYIAHIDQHGSSEEDCAAACIAWDRTHSRVSKLQAVTLAGISAKARVLHLAVLRETVWSDGFDACRDKPEAISDYLRADGRIAWSLCDDILALRGAA